MLSLCELCLLFTMLLSATMTKFPFKGPQNCATVTAKYYMAVLNIRGTFKVVNKFKLDIKIILAEQ